MREGREGPAQGPEIHAQSSESSVVESREGVEVVQWPEIEPQSTAEESREGVVDGVHFAESLVVVEIARWRETEVQSTESSVVANESSSEESRDGVEEVEEGVQFAKSLVVVEIARGRETEVQSTESSVVAKESSPEESREGQIEVQFAESSVEGETAGVPEIEVHCTESLVVAEESSSEESKEDTEEAEIVYGPEIVSQSAESSVMVEEFSAEKRRVGVEEAGINHGRTIESELEEGEIIDSPMAAVSSVSRANPHILSVGTETPHSLPEARQESQTSVICDASQESCKMWLQRGNEAYAMDHFLEAEIYYTHAVNFASEIRTSRTSIQALTLCHSNRAATRIFLGRMRDAIGDCEIALANDSSFLRARVRMANCYLALGDIEAAKENYKICFQPQEGSSSERNRKILFEASDGLKNAQQVDDCMNQSMELLRKRTKDDASKALGVISKAMSISTHSESLLEMKVECLLVHCKYEEIIQICEHTPHKIEKNSIIIGDNGSGNQNISEDKLWRWRALSMAYFYLGRLKQALELLQKHDNLKPVTENFGSMFPKTSTSLSVVIRELLGLQAAGNEAFHARKFSDAVDHYTAALALSAESRPFAAKCFCRRAAAYQELGKVMDAIADCCFAITLDSSCLEAISKRATLHELIRDYEQAADDMKLVISIFANQIKEQNPKFRQSDLEQARLRLCTLKEKAKKGIRTDMYMILGVTGSSSMTDVKNAYRRAALKHHPDKSGLLLIKSENVNEGFWRDIADEVHSDAERIFKLIGEAYDVLSDVSKRQKYEEEERGLRMKPSNAYAHRSNEVYKQSRNGYSFNQGYEQSRYAHQSGPWRCNDEQNRNAYGFDEGYEQSRNAGYAHRSGPQTGNGEYAHRSDPQTGNGEYAHRSRPWASNAENDHRSNTRNEDRSNAANFYRRYPHSSYVDLNAQYDHQEKWSHDRWWDDRR